MKKIDAKEMRAVEGGGMWYTTKCGGYSFYTSRWTGAAGWAKAKIHYIFCSQCQINNKLTGWWLRFGRYRKLAAILLLSLLASIIGMLGAFVFQA